MSALAFCASASAADVGAFKPPFLDISLKTAFAAACATCAGVAPNCDANATAVDALACPGAIEPPAEFGFAPSIAETDDNPAAPHFMSPPPSSSSLLSMFSSSSSLSSYCSSSSSSSLYSKIASPALNIRLLAKESTQTTSPTSSGIFCTGCPKNSASTPTSEISQSASFAKHAYAVYKLSERGNRFGLFRRFSRLLFAMISSK
mmetsp:Transcript_1661/g.5221  ORF Transcript_1661/g.5221 Transcript_1661/m.5221 type:complete len:204 (+) Transcript_1661:2875-3486(+)